MKVIPPLTMTDAILTNSSVVEPAATETAWNAATSYTLGMLVYRATTHRLYENLIAGVDAGIPELMPKRWLDRGPTNRWAMFDLLRNTASVAALSMTFTLTPGRRIDAIALLGMIANSCTIVITVATVAVYSKTIDLNTREILSWYEYFFKPFSTQQSIVLFDLPPYTNAVITVTLNATSGNVSLGACVIGSQQFIGNVQYAAESDVLNFSTVTRDFAGGTNAMVQRRNVPKTVQSIFADKRLINAIRDLRDVLNATPAVWAGVDNNMDQYFEAILILGFYKRFSINLTSPVHIIISLELEEI